MVPDLARTQQFYAQLLGWEYTPTEEQYGGYCNALVGGRQVAGLSPVMSPTDEPAVEFPPVQWGVYLATDDVAETDARVLRAGGQQVAAPMQVGPFGHMALWTDPTGAFFGGWQSAEHTGFGVVDEPGAVGWIDLMSHDHAAAKTFYADVFGFTYEPSGMEGMTYDMVHIPGSEQPVAGIGQIDAGEQMPSAWGTCFRVTDADEVAGRVESLGGGVVMAPHDFPYGRLAVLTGADGEFLAVLS